MYKKSTIQQQIEINELKGKLANAIETFIDKYTVDDIVFGLVNGTPQEVIKGYLVEMQEYSTLKEAIQNMKVTQCIRFNENKFYVGDFKTQLNECNMNAPVFDIELLQFSQLTNI